MTSKKAQKIALKICLTSVLMLILISQVPSIGGTERIEEQASGLNAYSTSGIVINDSNIASYSSAGSGASDAPYIIDNLYINTTDYPVRFDGVSAGTYYELRDSHLIGRGTYGVYIHDITNGEASIINCTVEATLAIGGSNAKYLTIDNCTLKFTQGSHYREGLTFTNNIVSNVGIYSGSVIGIHDQDNTVENNIFYGNASSFSVSRVTNTIIRNNILHKTGFYFSTDEAAELMNNTIENNLINGRPFGLFVNRNNEIINAENYAQAYIVNSTNTIVEKLSATDVNIGMQVHNCTEITLRDIEVRGRRGIEVENTNDILIKDSILEGYGNGIDMDEVDNIVIQKNHLTGFEYGIEIAYAKDVQINNNTLLQMGESGFYLDNITNFEMKFNIVTSDIQDPGSDLVFYSWELQNALIYYNVFINYGNLTAPLMHDENSINVKWYDETLEIGNHYSDWNGTGTYTIPGDGNIDLYPFIDIDGDNLTENAEVMVYHTNPFEADSDGDGFDDYTEIMEGTDPLDPKDYPGRGTVLAIVLGTIFGLGLIAAVLYILNRKEIINIPFLKKK
ncbi:MAG: hypothetical protein GOP50_04415 [Candidatus Heimdallarchaeota archaeon]|nr:hypothetical protein [Candidatus Heimdallarchaeota archaeon]